MYQLLTWFTGARYGDKPPAPREILFIPKRPPGQHWPMPMDTGPGSYIEPYSRICSNIASARPRRSIGSSLSRTPIVSLDSTMIPVCIEMFEWAKYVKTKGAVKMHTVLDNRSLLPQYSRTNCRMHGLRRSHLRPKSRRAIRSVLVFFCRHVAPPPVANQPVRVQCASRSLNSVFVRRRFAPLPAPGKYHCSSSARLARSSARLAVMASLNHLYRSQACGAKYSAHGRLAALPNPSLKLSTNGVPHWPSSAGPLAHFALAVQRAIPLSPA